MKIKGRYNTLIIIGIMFVIWNILVLVIPKELKECGNLFWWGYAFTSIAFVAVAGSVFYLKLGKGVTFAETVPAHLVTFGYFGIALIMNIIFMIINKGEASVAVIVANAVLLLLACALFIVANLAMNHISSNREKVQKNVRSIKLLAIKVGQIASKATDPEIKKALYELKEKIEYSDPMTVPDIEPLNDELGSKIDELDYLVGSGSDEETLKSKIASTVAKLQERNDTLRALK